ncbi:hypothetical protein T4E_5422 [Trichinella pseudospiralis]|uniref:Uncharacterized protein n=1 Tax=Trichinella pseudospiralis TaxID=6337 RepID=A0A0V0XJR4_TRIPS|nr:hypothetical protein T4E_991 [Trichinella pseudospiralis]KRX88039.1 hypothetical protein T4E_5422 [Trichinella pseudospiralis]
MAVFLMRINFVILRTPSICLQFSVTVQEEIPQSLASLLWQLKFFIITIFIWDKKCWTTTYNRKSSKHSKRENNFTSGDPSCLV